MGEFIVAQKAIILYNNKILIMQKSGVKWKIHKNKWEFVGGCLEFGENLTEGLTREIKEETGLAVCVDRLLCASTHPPIHVEEQKQFVFLYYLCHANDDNVTLSDEHKDYLWATLEQVKTFVDKAMLGDVLQALDNYIKY